jgi:hypothetical protein
LPPYKFDLAFKAVRQLEAAGVVRESDSPWRSNVVMVPKPMGKNELRANTKADYQTGSQNTAMHYRICLDFRDLNNILEFPQQVAFPTIEKFLHKLREKIVVNKDISSSFYVILIKEEDRYKTAFWLNDLAFEFNPPSAAKFFVEFFPKIWICYSQMTTKKIVFLRFLKLCFESAFFYVDVYVHLAATGMGYAQNPLQLLRPTIINNREL